MIHVVLIFFIIIMTIMAILRVMMILINEKNFVNEWLKVWIGLVIGDFLIKMETFIKFLSQTLNLKFLVFFGQ